MTAADDPVRATDPSHAVENPALAAATVPARSRGGHQDVLPDDPDVRRFADELGMLWQQVRAWTSPLDESASQQLYELMDAVRRQNVAAGLAVTTVATHAGDLSALRAGWPHFSPGQKAVLNAATAYVLDADRIDPDYVRTARNSPEEEAALVVTAAVRALLHRR